MTIRRSFAALALLTVPLRAAAAERDFAPYLIADRAEEVALARSAAPARVSDAARVLVLTRTGYVEAAPGTNGFTCLVVRSFGAGLDDPAFWRPAIRAPHCLNPAAVGTVLPEMLKRAEWVLAGLSTPEIAARTKSAYDAKEFPRPAAGALAYMLSPKQVLVDGQAPHWMPHLMFYVDRAEPASAWGAGDFDAPVIDGTASDPKTPVQVFFVPVRRWSDGTPAMGEGH